MKFTAKAILAGATPGKRFTAASLVTEPDPYGIETDRAKGVLNQMVVRGQLKRHTFSQGGWGKRKPSEYWVEE